MNIVVPPIKSQGIKTKLVPWIQTLVPKVSGKWIEPFLGTTDQTRSHPSAIEFPQNLYHPFRWLGVTQYWWFAVFQESWCLFFWYLVRGRKDCPMGALKAGRPTYRNSL